MEELELTHELQRFSTRFDDRVTQATEVLERSADPRVRAEALRKNLLYVSSAIEIATGPFAEVNLLDMIVFVHLCRRVLDTYWIPTLYGDDGLELSETFAISERELSAIADRALSGARRQHVTSVIDAWLAAHPKQIRVEGIRFADFASDAAAASADRMLEAKGLLSSVRTATEAANQALLLTERGMFLLHRMPSVWRLQARLAAREIVDDAVAAATVGPEAPAQKVAQRARELAKMGAIGAAALGTIGLYATWRVARGR